MRHHPLSRLPFRLIGLIGGAMLGFGPSAPSVRAQTPAASPEGASEAEPTVSSTSASAPEDSVALELVATSDHLWTGVAVSREGRIFVNFPRWSPDIPMSVAEVVDGEPVPFPSEEWNRWKMGEPIFGSFVCVQSVVVDDQDVLWVLDAANPMFSGVVVDGPRLIRVDLVTGKTRIFKIPLKATPRAAYLNDVRIDTERRFAYITESGTGAILIVDLNTGGVRRHLSDHPSTKAENVEVVIEGVPWKIGGLTPRVHADGIALSPDRGHLYYQALTAHTVYRVPTQPIRDPHASPVEVGEQVEVVARSGVADGIIFDESGYLYLSALEESAINRLTPDGRVERVVKDERLRWPDSFAWGPDGHLYVTTSQINYGADPPGPYGLYRFRPPPPFAD